jgi:hypothetical protein
MTIEILTEKAIEITGKTTYTDFAGSAAFYGHQTGRSNTERHPGRPVTLILKIMHGLSAGIARARRMGSSSINEQLYVRNECKRITCIKRDL